MRILIVEDEKKTAAYLQKGLTEQGFIVDVGIDGEEGLLLATTIEYDLIISRCYGAVARWLVCTQRVTA